MLTMQTAIVASFMVKMIFSNCHKLLSKQIEKNCFISRLRESFSFLLGINASHAANRSKVFGKTIKKVPSSFLVHSKPRAIICNRLKNSEKHKFFKRKVYPLKNNKMFTSICLIIVDPLL